MAEQPNSAALDLVRSSLYSRYRTPSTIPDTGCLSLSIPNDQRIRAAIFELLDILQNTDVWQAAVGELSADDTVALIADITRGLAIGECPEMYVPPPFDAYCTLQEIYDQNVEPAYSVANTWQNRVLNLSEYEFNLNPTYEGDGVWTFPAGTYFISGAVQTFNTNRSLARLIDNDTQSPLAYSQNVRCGTNVSGFCFFNTHMYLPAETSIILQIRGSAVGFFGAAFNVTGFQECYARMAFWRQAEPN